MINSETSFEPPYVTADLPGIGGVLRSSAEHFVVQERPLYEPSGEGQHLYVSLTKVGMTTKELQRELAKVLQLDQASIGFAGMKDKHARTTKTFSLPTGHMAEDGAQNIVDRIAGELPITVHWAKRHGNKLKAGHLLGNHFQITVSNLPEAASALLPRAEAIIGQIQKKGVANYFGPQRFGINGGNVAKGHDVLTGKKRIKDRWLRRFLVSSYQSYLCNLYLGRRVDEGNFEQMLAGDIAKKHDTGGIFDVEDLAAEQLRFQNQEISFTAPMYGPKMKAATGDAGQLEEEILEASGVTLNHFRRAKADGTRRLGRLLVPEITVSSATADTSNEDADATSESTANDQLLVEFFLPKGAFATTILREIMKVTLETTPDIE